MSGGPLTDIGCDGTDARRAPVRPALHPPTTLPMAGERHPDPAVRRAQRVLLMVHELHKRGYQRLRIIPGMSPSGTSWRCGVTPASNVRVTHGAREAEFSRHMAMFTSAQGNAYFGWTDARTDTARDLVTRFLERFPDIAGLSRGPDWAYAGWYVEMLGHAERGSLPVAYADWYDEPDPRWLPTTEGFQSGLPMPPGGEAAVGTAEEP